MLLDQQRRQERCDDSAELCPRPDETDASPEGPGLAPEADPRPVLVVFDHEGADEAPEVLGSVVQRPREGNDEAVGPASSGPPTSKLGGPDWREGAPRLSAARIRWRGAEQLGDLVMGDRRRHLGRREARALAFQLAIGHGVDRGASLRRPPDAIAPKSRQHAKARGAMARGHLASEAQGQHLRRATLP